MNRRSIRARSRRTACPCWRRASGLVAGRDFAVGYSPERINPGDKTHRFETIVKVVSAQDAETLDIVADVYGSVVTAGVHRAPSIRVAEAAKVIENTQRDLNIAFMNELSAIFHRLGIDTGDVLAAAATKWNFLNYQPGLVGGHCIGVDPYYLTYRAEKAGYHPEIILAGRRINDGMGAWVARECVRSLMKRNCTDPLVTVLGMTFKEDVPDIRNSKVIDIVRELERFGIRTQVHDPLALAEETKHEYGVALTPREALAARRRDRAGGAAPRLSGRRLAAHAAAPARRQGHGAGREIAARARAETGRYRSMAAVSPVLVTGAAGFIGFHVARRLLQDGRSGGRPRQRQRLLRSQAERGAAGGAGASSTASSSPSSISPTARAWRRCSSATAFPTSSISRRRPACAIRWSILTPMSTPISSASPTSSKAAATTAASICSIASSSSVYGANTHMPFSVHDNVDHPLSLYGASKKANELMAHAYAHLFRLPTTGLRFFTVYGPWGRPDMAMWLFAKAIMAGEPIKLFNNGDMRRDFTYIDDIVEAIVRLVDHAPAPNPAWSSEAPDPGSSNAPWRVYNIGNNNPVELMEVVRLLEESIGMKAKRELLPMQPGDVPATYADVDDLMREVDFKPATPIGEGIARFVAWYKRISRALSLA